MGDKFARIIFDSEHSDAGSCKPLQIVASVCCNLFMSSKNATVRARIDSDMKEEAEEILEAVGLSPTEVVRALYAQIILQKGLPFEAKIPNKLTSKTIRDARRGKGLKKFDNAEDFFRSLEE